MHESPRACLATLACAIGLVGIPCAAYADWNVGADASWRHDDNMGNAHDAADIVGDSVVAARLSVFQLFPVNWSYTITASADLAGEYYDHIHGVSNASAGGAVAIRKRWGIGAFAPWARIGLSAARSAYDDSYRNASIYRAIVSGGRRLSERWNVTADYTYERREAGIGPSEDPIPADAYSQTSHTLGLNAEYEVIAAIYLSGGLVYRHGDVTTTTLDEAYDFTAARAKAEDPAFGPEAYAYRFLGDTYGLKLGIHFTPATHHALGVGFARFETRAGGTVYTKSVPEITWMYRF